jgi:Type II secretion system (T2SS), protein M subtype b
MTKTHSLIRRAAALVILFFVLWTIVRAIGIYIDSRAAIVETAEMGYVRIRERRLDIAELRAELTALRSAANVRKASFEASSEKAVVLALQSHLRTVAERSNGRLISSIQSNAVQIPDTVAILARGRLPQVNFSNFLNSVERGNPAITLEELSISARGAKPGDAADVEWTVTARARWMVADR